MLFLVKSEPGFAIKEIPEDRKKKKARTWPVKADTDKEGKVEKWKEQEK